ncbi:unnamed protein product [Meganyctiphanes norvegica]|uniref:CUB domain-containing protein n=1 Tax=Meganyctiphanes norvegica TaxID=48144 RepID=A0AAV2Q5U4_MEGNR
MRVPLLHLSTLMIFCWLHIYHCAPEGNEAKVRKWRQLMSSSSGRINSTNYPLDYSNNENCVWTINAPEGTKIVLSFMTFELENNHDYLEIRNGDNASSPLIHNLTGRHWADIISPANQLHLTFTSDGSVTNTGFYISWEFKRPSSLDVVKQYAPILRFDSKFGTSSSCFPSSASDYYNARNSNNKNRICNTAYSTMTSGSVPTYWRAMECGENLHIAYWFFSGYQDTCFLWLGAHDSDWERVVVKVENYKTSAKLGAVIFYQHSGWYTKKPGNYEVHDGTHPTVYSGKNSHGSYHDDGGSGGCCYYEDFRNPGSKNQHMRTWLNLEELRRGESKPDFMKDMSSKKKFDTIPSPLERADTYELCRLKGCKGSKLKLCTTSGCAKSEIASDQIF